MIVVDCSIILDLLVRPSSVGELAVEELWCAPELLAVEIVAGVRGLLLKGEVDPATARELLVDYAELDIRLFPASPELQARMVALAHNISAYDAAYVALAEALGASLATHDRRLAAASAELVEVLDA